MATAKKYTLITRGLSKDEKNSLKRMVKNSRAYSSINQLMLGLISEKTAPEIAEYKKIQQQKSKV